MLVSIQNTINEKYNFFFLFLNKTEEKKKYQKCKQIKNIIDQFVMSRH